LVAARYRGLFFDSARWNGFALRPGDVVVSTPAKCGTTWTQAICAFLVRGSARLEAPLDALSPWLDSLLRPLIEVRRALEGQAGRRVIKTHTPLDGIPSVEGVAYLCVGRDLRDAFASWDDHVANVDPARLLAARAEAVGLDDLAELFPEGPPPIPPTRDERFRVWIESPLRDGRGVSDLNLALALAHLTDAWSRRDEEGVLLLHYADLRADLAGVMARIAAHLGIAPEPAVFDRLVEAATFARMRERADELAPETTSGIWRETGSFFRTARTGSWRESMNEEIAGLYEQHCRESAPPALIDWIHRGERATFGS